jgi:hypothetical protein
MCKRGSAPLLSVETVPGDGSCSFRRFRQILSFEVIQNNVQLGINIMEDCKIYVGRKWSVFGIFK